MNDMADNRDKAFKADQERIAKENEEQVAKTEGLQPTPTQAENDRAKLGVESLEELDNKEPDGSPEQRDIEAGQASSYTTRNVSAKK
jgi:hypothetical protein